MNLGMTGGRVWDAAVVLAKMIEFGADKYFHFSKDTPVLELGAGCGLSGMATAVLGIPTV
jgi:predicted nicotinamide N-methyase